MSAGGRFAFLDQLSSREKTLVAGVGLLAACVFVLLGWLYVDSRLGEVQEEIDMNDGFISDIERASERYLSVQSRCKAMEDLIRNNRTGALRNTINNIARGVVLTDGKKLSDEIGSLKQETETRIGQVCEVEDEEKNRRRRRTQKEEAGGVVRVEQDFEFRNIPIDAIFSLLDGIERSAELLFVTQVDIRRKFGAPEEAQSASIRVATYRMEQVQ